MINDITGQKALENSKDEFIGTISHELKNPLCVIRSLTQTLVVCLQNRKAAIRELGLTSFTAEALIPATETECLQKTLAEIDRMTKIIDKMVQITRIDSGNLGLQVSACDLAIITREVIAGFRELTHANRIRLECEETGLRGLIDPGAFHQITTNLISNALKYSPPNSTVLVKLYRHQEFVCLSVTDHGIGISLEEQRTIFHKFCRTYSATKFGAEGLGLGLYITKKLVELHGGVIKLTSQPGCGSTFEASFPAVR